MKIGKVMYIYKFDNKQDVHIHNYTPIIKLI